MRAYVKGFIAAVILVAISVIRVDNTSIELPDGKTKHTVTITAPHVYIEVSVDT